MRIKTERHTDPVDDKFVSVVLTNQMNFNTDTYRLKRFAFPDQESYPADYALTANIQKYINKLAQTRLEIYKHAMRDIESVTTEHIIGTNYFRLINQSTSMFSRKIYSPQILMEYCTDVCTYTRCAYMKGLNPSKYWPIREMAEYLLNERFQRRFFDRCYGELDRFLLKRVQEIERNTGPMNLHPIELSLEWVNYPISESMLNVNSNSDSSSSTDERPYESHIYTSLIEYFSTKEDISEEAAASEDKSRKSDISRNILGVTGTSENITENFETPDNQSIYYDSSDALSIHSETSDDFSGNYDSTDDENLDYMESTPKRGTSGAIRRKRKSLKKRQKKSKKLVYLRI